MVNDAARVKSIFLAAVERYPAEQWPAYLDGACGEDNELRDRVQRLLEAHGDQKSLHIPSPSQADVTVDRPIVERPGDAIGPYRLMEQIGEGGMGVVYVAEQHQPVRRKVALKIIKPGMDTKQVVARFEAERQALALMDHPNIARVIDAGATESGRPFFVMELVRGIPITDYCDRERLSIPERLELFVLVCRAVQHAHQKGIIHRDLKPSNVLVTVIDGAAVPKVIDFGVAKATGGTLTERTIYTAFQQFIGTPLYMSPEQADLAGVDVDTRSDIYSLGVLLYELLTGTTPFDQETFRTAAFDEMRRILREQEPPRPSTRLSTLGAAATTVSANRKADARQLDRTIRGELDWVVMKALEKDRRRRYETANDFATDVMRYLTDQPVQACPPSAGYRLRKFVRRNKGPVAAGLSLAALLVLGTVGTSIGLVWALRAERTATQEKERAAAAEKQANEEAAVAGAVRDFLTDDLLAEAAPDKNARNKKVTVEELLGRAAARLAGKFAQQPRIEAEIRVTIGFASAKLGDYTGAHQQLERAWEIGRRDLGEDHPRTLYFMGLLGAMYVKQGKFAQAEPLLLQAMEVSRRALGPEHAVALAAMHYLGGLYGDQGKFAQAEPLLVQALEIFRRLLGEEHTSTLGTMNDLATVYQCQGKLAQAEPLVVRALEVRRRILGDEHPDTLFGMNNLAMLWKDQGKLAQAEPLFVQVLEGRRRVLGEEHPDTLSAMNNLAMYYDSQRQYPKAEPLFVQALEGRRRVLGEDHPDTLAAMNNLAVMHERQGKLAQVEPLLVQMLKVCRRVRGEEHSDTLQTVNNLAKVYQKQGKLAEAKPLFIKTLEVRRSVMGEDHRDTLGTMDDLASLYSDQREYSKAEELFVQALEIRRRVLREEHPETLGAMNNLAVWYHNQGQLTKAEPLFVKVLEIGSRVHGRTDPRMLTAARNLAGVYWFNGKFERSIPLLEDILKPTRDKLGPDHPDTLMTMAHLGVSYRDAGRLLEGTDLLEQARANALKQPGSPAGDSLAWISDGVGAAYERAGQFAKAESLYRETLETVRQRHREASGGSAALQAALAWNLLKQQRHAEAEPLLRECLSFREQKETNDYPTYNTKSLLGGSLLGQKKYAEAEPLLLAGYEGMKQREGKIPLVLKVRLTESIERLVQLYQATGKTDKAAEWRKKLSEAKSTKPAGTKQD
jgi:serine/threonine protein kinase/tetratricopeptide (TPR) repeat protein